MKNTMDPDNYEPMKPTEAMRESAKELAAMLIEKQVFPPLVEKQGAVNYDEGKLRLDLIPPEVTVALALAFGYGAEKYSDDNWLKGMNWSRHIGSLERHLLDWKMGQTYDKESGNHHLSHALVRMAMLLVYELRELGNDDRKICYRDSDHLTEVLRKPSGPYQYELPL